MGRFARSSAAEKARPQFIEPRRAARFKEEREPKPAGFMDRLSRRARRNVRLIIITVMALVAMWAGWLMGKTVIGPPAANTIQQSSVMSVVPEAQKPAAPDADDKADNKADDRDKDREDDASRSRRSAVPATQSDGEPREHYARHSGGHSRVVVYARGGTSFSPTSIVTKPAKVMAKPFKKINPFKKLW